MTSSPDVSRGGIAARNERAADRGAQSGHRTPREGALLRGASAAQAVSYVQAAPVPPQGGPRPRERRTTTRGAAGQPVPGGRPTMRLGDVYAAELTHLREQAHAKGFAAGHAEGLAAAEVVVAEAERA